MAKAPQGYLPRLQAALAALNGGDLATAAAACAILRREAPDEPAILQLHATIALRAGAPAEALVSIARSLELRPGHVPSLVIAGRAALAADAPLQAATHLREAVRRAPQSAEPTFLLCRALLNVNDAGVATVLATARMRFPSEAPEWQALGLVLHRAGRSDWALSAFTQAATADPLLAQAHLGCGLVLREAGRMRDAQRALRQATARDPSASAAWFALGLTCQDLLDEAGAADAFAAALRERPNFAEAAVNLGIALQRQGEMDAALAAYRRAIAIRPDTLGRIAQALSTASTGMLWLDPAALRNALGA